MATVAKRSTRGHAALAILGTLWMNGCGSPDGGLGGSLAELPREEPAALAALPASRRDHAAELAREEKAAVALAGAALQHEGLERSFSDYVTIQRRLHEELLAQLTSDESLAAVVVSEAGAAMLAALAGQEGAALERRYYGLQRPWQQSVLQRLREGALPEAYRGAALQRWGRDLAALEALDR